MGHSMSSNSSNRPSRSFKDFQALALGLFLGMLTVGLGYLVVVKFATPEELPDERPQFAEKTDVATNQLLADSKSPTEKPGDSTQTDTTSTLPEMATDEKQEVEVASEEKALVVESSSSGEPTVDPEETVDSPSDVKEVIVSESKTQASEKFPVDSNTPVEKGSEETTPDSNQSSATQEAPSTNEDKKDSEAEKKPREDVKLSKKKWTTLVLLPANQPGESPIPEDFPVWNFPKNYSFSGDKFDQHRLGSFSVDGEFIIRNGYIVREFGKDALLRLPIAKDFDLEGIIAIQDKGGWMILVGWDIEAKSGYAIYNTQLVQGGHWFLVEIKDGKAVEFSVKKLVAHETKGLGPLRLRVDNKKVSMQAAGAYLFRDVPLPNYQEGHVAIGTFNPNYGPRQIGIKSLRMMLR
jgi:hypothetical protein